MTVRALFSMGVNVLGGIYFKLFKFLTVLSEYIRGHCDIKLLLAFSFRVGRFSPGLASLQVCLGGRGWCSLVPMGTCLE